VPPALQSLSTEELLTLLKSGPLRESRGAPRLSTPGVLPDFAFPKTVPEEGAPHSEILRAVQEWNEVIHDEDKRCDVVNLLKPPAPSASVGERVRAKYRAAEAAHIQERARAAAAFMFTDALSQTPDGAYRLVADSVGHKFELCDGERFAAQTAAAFCSGVLVAPNWVATARHCLEGVDGAKVRIVFGYVAGEDGSAPAQFPKEAVRAPAQVAEIAGSEWALVRLDRPVDIAPAPLRRAGHCALGAPLYLLGFPNGAPLKYADGATIRSDANKPVFKCDLDAFSGNSGSMVVNADTHEVEGLLLGGEHDWISTGLLWFKGCNVVHRCNSLTDCDGERVVSAAEFAPFVP
jgi:hypothetical protein